MLADGEITPMRFRGKLVRFYFAGCVAGVEGEGKDVETECCEKSVKPLRAATITGVSVEGVVITELVGEQRQPTGTSA